MSWGTDVRPRLTRREISIRPDSVGSAENIRPSWRRPLLLTLVLRIVYSILAALISLIQPVNWGLVRSNALTASLPQPDHSLQYLFFGVWERFDTLWYLHIARYGYNRPEAIVFFPLYPLLIRIMSAVMPPVVAALLISTASSFFLFWGLQEWLRGDHGASLVARTVFACGVWPASFILFAGYPESLLLALIVGSFCMARKERWPLAVGLGLAAALTKGAGVVVAVPLFIMAIRHKKAMTVPILLIPLASIGFLRYLQATGHGTILSAYAQYWRTSTAAPWTTLWIAVQTLAYTSNPILLLNLAFLALMSALALSSRVSPEYLLFSAAAIAMFLCKNTTPPLQSMMRYLLIIFPAFLGFASLFQPQRLGARFGMVCAGLFVINLGVLWLFLGWSLVL